MRKQAYEQKRKEFEQLRKLKRKQQSPGEPRKRKRKEKSVDGEGLPVGALGDPMGQPAQPKKRQRKSKKQTQSMMEEDLEAKAEFFLQTLRTLPTVALMEPKVGNFFTVSPIPGSPTIVSGLFSFMSYCLLVPHSSCGTLIPSDVAHPSHCGPDGTQNLQLLHL